MLANHLRVFPDGQIGVELDGELVATSSSMLVEGSAYQDPHTYRQVSDSGTMNTHEYLAANDCGVSLGRRKSKGRSKPPRRRGVESIP